MTIGSHPVDPYPTLGLTDRVLAADRDDRWVETTVKPVVYASWGLWVADCPNCPNAEHYGAHPQTGYTGGLKKTVFRCSACFTEGRPAWPGNLKQIEALLSVRSSPANRNWTPGETIEQLAADNKIMVG